MEYGLQLDPNSRPSLEDFVEVFGISELPQVRRNIIVYCTARNVKLGRPILNNIMHEDVAEWSQSDVASWIEPSVALLDV